MSWAGDRALQGARSWFSAESCFSRGLALLAPKLEDKGTAGRFFKNSCGCGRSARRQSDEQCENSVFNVHLHVFFSVCSATSCDDMGSSIPQKGGPFQRPNPTVFSSPPSHSFSGDTGGATLQQACRGGGIPPPLPTATQGMLPLTNTAPERSLGGIHAGRSN